MEPESDEEMAHEIESPITATGPKTSSVHATGASTTSSSSTPTSSSSGENGRSLIAGGETEAQKHPEAGPMGSRPAMSTSMESSSYHVSTSDPVEVAATLGVPEAKLIGGNIVGNL